ncbi:hypothetical protein SA58113_2409 [Staphylococcus argenteus]|nr:hypothetical protein SA58113_2409 [Staphylococcus argenteus]
MKTDVGYKVETRIRLKMYYKQYNKKLLAIRAKSQ